MCMIVHTGSKVRSYNDSWDSYLDTHLHVHTYMHMHTTQTHPPPHPHLQSHPVTHGPHHNPHTHCTYTNTHTFKNDYHSSKSGLPCWHSAFYILCTEHYHHWQHLAWLSPCFCNSVGINNNQSAMTAIVFPWTQQSHIISLVCFKYFKSTMKMALLSTPTAV